MVKKREKKSSEGKREKDSVPETQIDAGGYKLREGGFSYSNEVGDRRYLEDGGKKKNRPTGKKLTEAQYKRFSKMHEWTLTQAAFLAFGIVPPSEELTPDLIFVKLPDSWRLVTSYCEVLEKNQQERDCKLPGYWLKEAEICGIAIDQTWHAIFPHLFHESLESFFGDEMDYRQLAYHLTRNIELPLHDLIFFALNTSPEVDLGNYERESDQVLQCLAGVLPNAKAFRKSQPDPKDWRVKPSQFFEHYPDAIRPLSAKAQEWLEWATRHPKLMQWFSTENGRRIGSTIQARTVSKPMRRGEGIGSASAEVRPEIKKILNKEPGLECADVIRRLDAGGIIDEVDMDGKQVIYHTGKVHKFKTIGNLISKVRKETRG